MEGMRLVKEWLPAAVENGRNVEARSHMLIASSMGATAFQKGLGAMHSLSHPCGANLNTHHGLTNAVVMPYVLMWNRPAIEEKMRRLAAYLGLPGVRFRCRVEMGARAAPADRDSQHAGGHRCAGRACPRVCGSGAGGSLHRG